MLARSPFYSVLFMVIYTNTVEVTYFCALSHPCYGFSMHLSSISLYCVSVQMRACSRDCFVLLYLAKMPKGRRHPSQTDEKSASRCGAQ